MPKTEPAKGEPVWFSLAAILGALAFFFTAAVWGWDVRKISLMMTGSITLFFVVAPWVCIALCFLLSPFMSVFSVATRKKS